MAPSILDNILLAKRGQVEDLKRRSDPAELRRLARRRPAGRDFLAALRTGPGLAVVAEIKRRSPSAGALREEAQVADLARKYRAGGARAVSVLTDGPFFGGSLDDLAEAGRAVDLPILCKDFIVDPIQLHLARLAGASATLLIAAALGPDELRELYAEAWEIGLTPLVEVHAAAELDRVLALDPPLVGVNNRDLTTLAVSLDTCLSLRPLIDPDILVVGESGIHGPEEMLKLRAAGVNAFLVGTALMRAEDPQAQLRRLVEAGVNRG